jgi:molybdenum cofactor cytidylyltransferase
MGQPKQLMLLQGVPLVRHAALALAGGGVDRLLAVIPAGEVGEGVRAALAGLPFAYAVNPDPARGLAGSFRVAAAALPGTVLPGAVAAAQFTLADMPLVTAGTHAAVLRAFRETGAPLVLTEYGDPDAQAVRAPPHLFRADLLPALAALPDADHGPRELLRAYAGEAAHVQVPAAQLLDVDTPDALAEAETRLG